MQDSDSEHTESDGEPNRKRKQLAFLSIVFGLVVVGYLVFRITFNPYHYIDLETYERRVFSQNGEDGVIEKIFTIIEPTSKFSVEFGAGDGFTLSSVRNLVVNHGWGSLMIEGDENKAGQIEGYYEGKSNVKGLQAWVYPGNVEILFEENGVPLDLDFLVVDIDNNDYYIWKVMHKYRPKVVMMEHNGLFAPPLKVVVDYNPMNYWDSSYYWGASIQSFYDLAKEKGYELIYVEKRGINLFFVDKKYYERFAITNNPPEKLYRPFNYRYTIFPENIHNFVDEEGYPKDGNGNVYFSAEPLTWDAFEIKKRFILGR